MTRSVGFHHRSRFLGNFACRLGRIFAAGIYEPDSGTSFGQGSNYFNADAT